MRAIWTRLAPGIATLALALASGAANADCDVMTGGGFIINKGAQANFGVAGGCKDGTPTFGHLEYIDHGAGLNVHWMSITAYFPDEFDAKARYICGTAGTNLYGNVDFIVRARDTAEPGTNDVFDIRLTQGGGIVYSTEFSDFHHKLNGGNGGGGNIQLQKPTTGDFSPVNKTTCPALFVGA